MKKMLVVLSVATCLSATPASADELLAVTPSGRPEVVFDKALNDTLAALSSYCMDRGWSIAGSTTNQVTCEIKMSFGQSVLGQMLMGNSYSTPPRQFVQFSAAQIGVISRVQATSWMELQMAFGQTKRNEFTGTTDQNNVQSVLFAAGGRLPSGTTFPNHAALGVEATTAKAGKKQVLMVTAATPGRAAERAGLQAGDVVIKIAGKDWKDDAGFLNAQAKAAKTSSYPVVVQRGGKEMTFTLDREFRDPVADAPALAPSAAAVAGTPTTAVAASKP